MATFTPRLSAARAASAQRQVTAQTDKDREKRDLLKALGERDTGQSTADLQQRLRGTRASLASPAFRQAFGDPAQSAGPGTTPQMEARPVTGGGVVTPKMASAIGDARTLPSGQSETFMPSSSGGRWVSSGVANPPPVTNPGVAAPAKGAGWWNAPVDSPQIQALLTANARSNPDQVALRDAAATAAAATAPSMAEIASDQSARQFDTPYGGTVERSNPEADRLLTKKAPGAGRSGSAPALTPAPPAPPAPPSLANKAGQAVRSIVDAPTTAADAVDNAANKAVSGVYNTWQDLKAGVTGQPAPPPVLYGGHEARDSVQALKPVAQVVADTFLPGVRTAFNNLFSGPQPANPPTAPKAIVNDSTYGPPSPLPAQAASDSGSWSGMNADGEGPDKKKKLPAS